MAAPMRDEDVVVRGLAAAEAAERLRIRRACAFLATYARGCQRAAQVGTILRPEKAFGLLADALDILATSAAQSPSETKSAEVR